jgi:vacuolar-type H+-ATPase subunit H
VEKLERVLAVEEEARHALGEADDKAAAMRAAALEEAGALEAKSAADSATAVAAQREKLLAAARAEAERLTSEAEVVRSAAGETARVRMDEVVASLAARFEG